MTSKAEAERIAAAINVLRPAWIAKSTETMILDHHAARPARDVLMALCYVVLDPDSKTPARINNPGPWWDFQIPQDERRTPDMPHPLCPDHARPHPCADCRPTLRPAPEGWRTHIRRTA